MRPFKTKVHQKLLTGTLVNLMGFHPVALPAGEILLLLSEGDFGYFIWNPDAESLLGIRCNEKGNECSHIEQYDLSKILK